MKRFGEIEIEQIDGEIENVSKNTKKTYKSIWKQFFAFCGEKGMY